MRNDEVIDEEAGGEEAQGAEAEAGAGAGARCKFKKRRLCPVVVKTWAGAGNWEGKRTGRTPEEKPRHRKGWVAKHCLA